MKWDELFMRHVYLIAMKSKDTSTKIGAVLVRDNEVFSEGYNGIPRGVSDEVSDRFERPEKYFWVEHAERNAIYNCARGCRSTFCSILYTQACPCADCARGVVNAGISEVVLHSQYVDLWNGIDNDKWLQSSIRSMEMFRESGVRVRYFNGILGINLLMNGIIVSV